MKMLAKLVLAVTLMFGSLAYAQHGEGHGGHNEYRGNGHIVTYGNGNFHDEHGHTFGVERYNNYDFVGHGYRDYRFGHGFHGYHGYVAPFITFGYDQGWNRYGCTPYDYYSGWCYPYDFYYGPRTGVTFGVGIR